MTKRLIAALVGLSLLTFGVVWAVVHYSFIYIGGRGFEIIEMVEKPVTVPVGDAEQVQVMLHMLYGDLHLASGTQALLAGSARYNVVEFAPHILYEEEGNRGRLLVDHLMDADNTRLINRTGRVSEWQLALSEQVPIDELEVVVGLGSGEVDLRGLQVRQGALALLTGDFTVDLRGAWPEGSALEIAGVTSAITVLLPSETGTLVTVEEGPFTLEVTGLTEVATPPSDVPGAAGEGNEDSTYYANAAYEPGATTLSIQVSHAFGTLKLIAE